MRSFSLKYFKMRISSFRESLDVYFQLLICSRSWVRHIDTYFDDVIIVKVTMAMQNFQKLLNPEINQNGGVWNILGISDYHLN